MRCNLLSGVKKKRKKKKKKKEVRYTNALSRCTIHRWHLSSCYTHIHLYIHTYIHTHIHTRARRKEKRREEKRRSMKNERDAVVVVGLSCRSLAFRLFFSFSLSLSFSLTLSHSLSRYFGEKCVRRGNPPPPTRPNAAACRRRNRVYIYTYIYSIRISLRSRFENVENLDFGYDSRNLDSNIIRFPSHTLKRMKNCFSLTKTRFIARRRSAPLFSGSWISLYYGLIIMD